MTTFVAKPTLHHVTEHWTLDPPVPATRSWKDRPVLVHTVERVEGGSRDAVTYQFRAVPLSTTGKPIGGLDYRSLDDASTARLVALIEEARS